MPEVFSSALACGLRAQATPMQLGVILTATSGELLDEEDPREASSAEHVGALLICPLIRGQILHSKWAC